MLPSETRVFLLSQHEAIRALADRLLEAAEAAASSPPLFSGATSGVASAIDALSAAVAAHNRDEQRLLERALPAADAWGAVRCASMDDHHRREHASMRGALIAAAELADLVLLVDHLHQVVAELREHMDVEERVLLHPSVLRDDVCVVDSFGG